ncbi:MAG: hypothetical protein L0Y44_02625, partial [Phycisphaerales bacterium]|nr:hypothetical protein [Phycisphaerales bacterium]
LPGLPGAGAGVKLFQADMTDFTLDRPVDALLCLFSSIGYIHPEDRLRAAARCFAAALRTGGALIVEPWIAPEDFIDGRPWLNTYDSDQLKLCRMVISQREGEMSILDFHWMAARAGAKEVERFVERHINWLCPRQTMLSVFNDAGFDCRLEPDGLMKGRGLIVGQKR